MQCKHVSEAEEYSIVSISVTTEKAHKESKKSGVGVSNLHTYAGGSASVFEQLSTIPASILTD